MPEVAEAQSSSGRVSSRIDSIPSSESSPARNTEESSQDDCLPFFLDDESTGPEGNPSFFNRRSSTKSSYRFSGDTRVDRRQVAYNALDNIDLTASYSSGRQKLGSTNLTLNNDKTLDEYPTTEPPKALDRRIVNGRSRAGDSQELIDQDYVLVSGPSLDVSSSLTRMPKPINIPFKLGSPPLGSLSNSSKSTAPMPINGSRYNNISRIGSLESRCSAPGTSQGSMGMGDAFEQPSNHCMTRINSLRKCATAITELLHEKLEANKQLEAFSTQLVILAIWKQALHICHTQAVSAMEGSPSQETTRLRRNVSPKHSTPDAVQCPEVMNSEDPMDVSSQIEREFLREVEHAEELAKVIEPGSIEMPDAMETIFQAALALGRNGGVDELMGNNENADLSYSKAVRLLVFLLVEASSLILNPPFSLTNSDRYRLRTYIDILNNRQGHLRSQRMAILNAKNEP